MRQLILWTAVAFATLAGCASRNNAIIEQAQRETEQRAVPYNEALTLMEKYRASTGCGTAEAQAVQAKIAQLEDEAAIRAGYAATEARQRHTEIAFAFADESLKRRCLDVADAAYRRLVEFYVGSAYGGIRDRARLGIDDVRTARATAQAKKE